MKVTRETNITFERRDMCELILNSLKLRDTLHNIVRRFIFEDDTNIRFNINGYDIKLERMTDAGFGDYCRVESIDITDDEKNRIDVIVNLFNSLSKYNSTDVLINISKDSY